MHKIDEEESFICPFIKDDCVKIDSLSNGKSVICIQCENFMWEKIVDKDVKIFNLGFQTPLIMLYNN